MKLTRLEIALGCLWSVRLPDCSSDEGPQPEIGGGGSFGVSALHELNWFTRGSEALSFPFNGGVCGAARVGFIVHRPQTSLAAACPTLRATIGTESRETHRRTMPTSSVDLDRGVKG